jgi:hypothetical protein
VGLSGLALSLALPLIIGPLTFVVMQGLKTVSAAVDALPPTAKRFAVAGIAVGLSLVGQATGLNLACTPDAGTTCLELLDADAVKAILSAAIAFALHWAKQQTKKPASGAPAAGGG